MKLHYMTTAAIVAMAVSHGAANAQDQDNAQTTASGGIADIVVTAQRREESLQKVSASVTAVTSEMLEQRQVVRPEELVFLAPDVKLSEGVGPTAKGFGVRGVGTTNFGGVSLAVPVVLDEFNIPAYLGFKSLFDVESVQVLKGPQGTLYSADSSAGLVSIVTKKPKLGEWSAHGRISYQQADSTTDFGTTSLNGALNIPLGRDAALRVNGYYTHRDPMFYNAVLDRKVEGLTDYGIRAKLLVEPTDNFSAEITAAYSRQKDPFHSPVIMAAAPGGYFAGLLNQYGQKAGSNNEVVFNGSLNQGLYEDYYVTSRLTFGFGDYRLTSLTSYQNASVQGATDSDNGPLPLLSSEVGLATPGYIKNQSETVTQELKLASPSGQRLTWVAGLYFSSANSISPGAIRGSLAPALVDLGLGVDFRYNVRLKPRTYAAYVQGTYGLADGLRVLAGGRIQKQTNVFRYDAVNLPVNGFVIPLTGYADVSGFREPFKKWGHAWKLGLEYDAAQDVMLYANATRGYKGPGYSILGVAPGDRTYVAPEIPMSYEAGFKAFLFDRKLRFNAAAFVTDYKNYQAQVTELTGSLPRLLTANAGALK